MLTCLLGAVVLSLSADDAEALASACKKFADSASYSFEVSTETERVGGDSGGGPGGGRGGLPGGDSGPQVVTGAYQKDKPVQLKAGETEAFKQGNQLVYLADGKWEAFDPAAMGGGRGGPGGAAGSGRGGRGGDAAGGGATRGGAGRGDAGGGDAAGRPQRGGAPGGGSGMRVFSLMGVNAPHSLLENIGDKVESVEKSEADGKVTYTAKLTEKGLEAMAGSSASTFGRRGGRGGPGGGAGGAPPAPDRDGTVKIVVKGEVVESVLVSTHTKMSFGERSIETNAKTAYKISKVGESKVEVPADALAKFEI